MSGVGLLSRLPLVVGEVGSDPVVLRAGLLLPDGRRVEVLDAHPFPPDITRVARLPAGLDTRRRDEDLAAIRATVDGLEDPSAALVLGDLNTSPTEPGYATLAAGLHDAHAEVGVGTGFTWRPSSLEVLGLGLLRIDYALSGNLLRPIAISEDCRLPGDHCRLYATLEVAATGGVERPLRRPLEEQVPRTSRLGPGHVPPGAAAAAGSLTTPGGMGQDAPGLTRSARVQIPPEVVGGPQSLDCTAMGGG